VTRYIPRRSATTILALIANLAAIAAAQAQDFSGEWLVTSSAAQGRTTATLQLERSNDGYTGQSGALDVLQVCPLAYNGEVVRRRLRLSVQCRGIDVGVLDLASQGTSLAGSGTLFGTAVTISAQLQTDTPRAPRTHDFDPTEFHPVTSSSPQPVLRLRSGDSVRTRTVDAYGLDERGAPASMPGNPGVGPFYVEGAAQGDTLAIRFTSIETNRATARMNTALDPAALMPGHVQSPGAVKDVTWLIDPERNAASLRSPSEKLKSFRAPLRPMIGVVTVAPAGFSVANRELGEWGGNLDYNEIVEGVTLYLPVFQAGGLIYIGDGHALQGDGEIAGQGLETSLAVEFEVTLIKNESFPQPPGFPPLGPWAENDRYVMVSGIGGDVTDALRRATTGLSLWLKRRYGLDDSEVAVVLGTSVEYDVASVISAKSHIVAKLPKDVLSSLGNPVTAQR
jgi:acetamidase/formamidase